MPTAPTRNSVTLDQFNDALRASPAWQAFIQRAGYRLDQPIRLSDQQRRALQRELESAGMVFPKGMEIDPAGNINQDQGMSRLWANPVFRWSVIGGAAIATLGAAGFGPLAGVMGGAGGGAAAGATGAAAGAGGGAAAGAAAGFAGTALRYGLQYGLPTVAGLIGTRMQTRAQRESDQLMADYYNRALEAEREERDYRRRWDEEDRRYGRYSDQYGIESDEEILRYGRARDEYGRLSDEERLWYDRAQDIRDKNYGYQQYGNFVETLEPYRIAGVSAADRLSQLVGGPSVPSTGSYLNLARTARESVQAVPTVPGRPTWTYTADRPIWNYPNGAGSSSGSDQGGTGTAANGAPVSTTMPVDGRPALVLLEGPDGSRREVPIAQAQAFISRGARRVA